jgi:hypothetical protein
LLLNAASEFYECLVSYTPPEACERDYTDISDPEFGEYALYWQEAKQNLDAAKKQEEYYRKKLIEFGDDGNCQGFGVRMTRVNPSGKTDWKALCKDLDISSETVEQYKKPQIGYYRLSVIGS